MHKVDIESMIERGLPKLPIKDSEKRAVEYVGLVYSGIDRVEAYKEIFPEATERMRLKALADKRDFKKTLTYHVGSYETGKFVRNLYSIASPDFYIRFVDKSVVLLNTLYDIGIDEDEKMGNRLNAIKTFLGNAPKAPQVIQHNHDVGIKDDFEQKLINRQKQLYAVANNENDILDAEVEEVE